MEHPALVSILLQRVFRRSSLTIGTRIQASPFALSSPLSHDDLEVIVGGLEIIPGSLPRKQQPE